MWRTRFLLYPTSMPKLMNPLTILTLLAVVLVLLSVAGDRRASAQGSTPVLVVNPSTSPVPVTGHVTFAGEHGHPLPVSISNTPVSVSISNTPTVGLTPGAGVLVGNPATAPVWVRDADNPARHIFRKDITANVNGNSQSLGQFFVPANQRLVIEYVSAFAEAPVGQKVRFHIDTEPFTPQFATFYLPPVFLGNGFIGFGDQFIASQQVRLYFNPGALVALFAERNSGSGSWITPGQWDLAGYLVDCTAAAPCLPSP